MTGFQKFIKYAAIAFGIYLSITIVLVLMGIASGFVDSSKKSFTEIIENNNDYKLKDISEEYTDITKLKIELNKLDIIIREGESFKIEATNIPDKIEIKKNGNELKINDKNISENFYTVNNALTIYIPEDKKLDNIEMELKDVSLDAEKLEAVNLKLEIYDNYCKIDELFSDKLEIDNEYGEIDIINSEVKTLNLDSNSGIEDFNIKITEKAQIDLDYSTTDISLIGTLEDYQINNKKQFGTIYINDKEIINKEEQIGNGNSKINIESKYAEMYIQFKEITKESYL